VLVDEAPERHREFLNAFVGAYIEPEGGGLTMRTPRGAIDVVTPAAFMARYLVPAPDMTRGERLAALRFAVRDVAATRAALKIAGISCASAQDCVVVGPQAAMGATIVFERVNR
jgi:hypothetical protein